MCLFTFAYKTVTYICIFINYFWKEPKGKHWLFAVYHSHHLGFMAMCVLFLKYKNTQSITVNQDKYEERRLFTADRRQSLSSVTKKSRGKMASSTDKLGKLQALCWLAGWPAGSRQGFPSGCTGPLSEITPQILSVLSFKPRNLPKLSSRSSEPQGVEGENGRAENRNKVKWQLSESSLCWVLLCVGNKWKPLLFQFLQWFIVSLLYLIPNSAVLFYAKEDANRTGIVSR